MTATAMLRMAAWWAAYVVTAWAGRQLVMPEIGLALVWPAAGVGALWLATAPTRREQSVAAALAGASLYYLIVVDVGLPEAAWWSAAQLAQTWVAAELLRRTTSGAAAAGPLARFEPRSTRGLVVLGVVATVASVLGAAVGSLGVLDSDRPWSWWVPLSWTIRNVAGIVVVVALLATLAAARSARAARATARAGADRELDRAPGGWAELAVGVVGMVGATVAVFGPDRHVPIAFVVIPFAVWLGLRFAPATALAATMVQGLLVMGLTLRGRGPFAFEDDLAVRATAVQTFVLLLCAIALLLAISGAEKRALLARAVASENAAQERAHLLAAVTRTMQEGLLVVDRTGRAVLSNPAAHRLLGPQAERLRLGVSSERDGSRNADGSPMPAGDRPALRALRGETVDQVDLARVDPQTGAARVLSVSAAPLDTRAGERLAVLVLSDVTEERARLDELKGFAGVVAHDLKGPVAGIRGWAEILDEQLDDLEGDVAAARATLLRMQGSAERSQHLVDDLLAYAQAGTGALDLQPTTLAEVWAQARSQLPTTLGAGCEIRYVHGDDAIEVDAVLVRQLLVNLVGNALKYVAPGVVPRVRISSRVVEGRLQVEVADNGIGIPREEQSKVFEGFVRSSRTGAYPGTGLGLAICARAVQRHGGVIGARDAGPDGGTLISFTLPRPATALVPSAPVAGTAGPSQPLPTTPAAVVGAGVVGSGAVGTDVGSALAADLAPAVPLTLPVVSAPTAPGLEPA